MTRARDMIAAALILPVVAMAGRCSATTARPIAIESSIAVTKGAARGVFTEYRHPTGGGK